MDQFIKFGLDEITNCDENSVEYFKFFFIKILDLLQSKTEFNENLYLQYKLQLLQTKVKKQDKKIKYFQMFEIIDKEFENIKNKKENKKEDSQKEEQKEEQKIKIQKENQEETIDEIKHEPISIEQIIQDDATAIRQQLKQATAEMEPQKPYELPNGSLVPICIPKTFKVSVPYWFYPKMVTNIEEKTLLTEKHNVGYKEFIDSIKVLKTVKSLNLLQTFVKSNTNHDPKLDINEDPNKDSNKDSKLDLNEDTNEDPNKDTNKD